MRCVLLGVYWVSCAFGTAAALGSEAPQVPSVAPAAPAAPAAGPLLNSKTPLEGVRTGGFGGPESYAALAAEGYKTYIDLRSAAEKAEDAEVAVPPGLRLEHIPIAGEADLNLASARALDALLDDRSLYPVVVACGSGNRVGALLALRAFWLDGTPAEAALDLGRRAGLTKMEPSVRMLLGLPPPLPPPPPKSAGSCFSLIGVGRAG